MLDRRWLTNNGPYVQELEQRIAAMVGVKHCVAMCNATIALEIAVRALGMSGEVIVPSFTFIATAHCLQWQEITPVFCDVDPRTHNIDPKKIEALITPRTSGIIGVHLWGKACQVEDLHVIAGHFRLKLLFDAAHAFGCSHGGRMIGGFGDAEVFSFHATKFFNTFEGGAVVTDDDALARKMRLMANFGFSGYDKVVYVGTNGKMSEVSAAMGLTGLESLESFIDINRVNYQQYKKGLRGVPGLSLIEYGGPDRTNFQYVVVEVDAAAAGLSRDQIVELLWQENVLARRYFYPGCHRMEPYKSYFPHARLLLPETERLCERVMVLPTGTGMDAHAIESLCAVIAFAVDNASAVRKRLLRTQP